ncbi:hypothetical protein Hamer_G018485 [Homarus americanus]|uniref:Uncharacterized protein n=1 Tax=Homarus americanus TaxID=6706 RepID=A0A8J5K1V5_HOMAM|nr:hypothetical protein Hamer_G018485 [Homarus americanus]
MSREGHDSTPSLDDVVALPDPAGSSAWVYHPEEEKNQTPLYPVGLDLLSDSPNGPRRLPARHASFVSPRYARVHQRPQRAQSFAVRRDLQISEGHMRPPAPVTCPELLNSRLFSQYARPDARKIHRSNSVNGRLLLEENSGGATLSRKFHACSLDDLDTEPVIQVGLLSRGRSRSEQSLTSTVQDSSADNGEMACVHRSTSVQERLLDGKTVLTSFGPINRPMARVAKPKGPAPPPPTKPKPVLPSSSLIQTVFKKEEQKNMKEISDTTTATTTKQTEEEEKSENKALNEKEGLPELPRHPEGLLRDPKQLTGNTKRVSTLERHLPLPVIEENIKNTRKRPAPQPRVILPSLYDDKSSRGALINLQLDNAKPSRPEIIKPPRPSIIDKPLRLVDKNMTIARPSPVKKPERRRTEGENAANLQKLEEVLTNILDNGAPAPLRATKSDENIMESLKALDMDTKIPKSILKKGPTKPSKYEVAHREALEDSKALLDQLPRGELQRNKIVLRVPSFRTAGCQTEAYRPVRRRASCAQTNLSVAPLYKENTTSVSSSTKSSSRTSPKEHWTKTERLDDPQEPPVLESSSSSSGYSSPEVGSKDPSPTHSGPPSPASSSVVVSDDDERRPETNVTVIEVNKSEKMLSRLPLWHGLDPVPPPRPPKPLRLRHMSDAAALMGTHGGLLVPVHRRTSQLPIYEDVFGLAALTENVMLLTEAINPVLVQSTRPNEGEDTPSSTTPRVVDFIRKTVHPSLQDDKPWDGRTTLVPRPRPAVRTHSLSLPRPSLAPAPRSRQTKDSRSPSPTRKIDQSHQMSYDNGPSTAAYLASLELLASHYRHQALANAKVS